MSGKTASQVEDCSFRTAYFVWVEHNALLAPPKRGRPTFYGLCSETRRIVKMTRNQVVVLVVLNTYIYRKVDGSESCEEAARCMDLRCKLNRTTWATLMQSLGYKRTPPEPKAGFVAGTGLNAIEFADAAFWEKGTSVVVVRERVERKGKRQGAR